MARKERIARYTADELKAMVAAGQSRTDWARVDRTTEEEVERQAAEDDAAFPEDWRDSAILGLPPRKQAINIRLDEDVIAWFKRLGPGYQTRINTVLRSFVKGRRGKEHAKG